MCQSLTLASVAQFLGWPNGMSDEEVFQFIVERERLLRLVQRLLETHLSDAATAEGAIRDRIEAIHRRA